MNGTCQIETTFDDAGEVAGSQLRIAIVSKAGIDDGGASVVACKLQVLLQRSTQFSSAHWTGERNPSVPRQSIRGGIARDLLFRSTRFVGRKAGFSDFSNITFTHAINPRVADICHVHDISGTVSPITLKRWAIRLPVVWTFHDCSPFTGGCLYPLNCKTYQHGCGNCPQLKRWPLLTNIDHTSWLLKYKLQLINQYIAAVICPSHWIANEAIMSGVRSDLLHVIPNAVDSELFGLRDKQAVRQDLGLPPDRPIVMIGSVNLANPYKGVDLALQATRSLAPTSAILAVGKCNQQMSLLSGDRVYFRDFTTDRSQLAKYYAASDVLLFPSLADNLPLMLLESMACGTPAVAFATGGIPEIVTHGQDGWIASHGDVAGLVAGLRTLLGNSELRQSWGQRARARALRDFNEQKFFSAHAELYQKVLRTWKCT